VIAVCKGVKMVSDHNILMDSKESQVISLNISIFKHKERHFFIIINELPYYNIQSIHKDIYPGS
jgi:hypothetical protein